jgi:type II secretory pathway component PulJ
MKKRHPLTLLEVVIAMGLTAVLLGALFRFYYQVSRVNLEAHQMRQKIFSLTLMQEKLRTIFAGLPKGEERVSFYTEEMENPSQMALFFTYDNGIDPDPAFCDQVKARLYLDEKKQLSLLLAPRKEVLVEGVERMSFRFFDASEKVWKEEWSKQEGELPGWMELTLSFSAKEMKPWTCLLFTQRSDEPIVFMRKKEAL